MLSIKDLGIRLGTFSLKNISLEVEKGEYVVILGMSGTGKTVLLEILSGLLQNDRGTITLDGLDITRRKIQKRPIRLVYQDQALFPHLSVWDNLAFSLRCQKQKSSFIKGRVEKIAEEVGVVHLLRRMPSSLSGGESQRVALGRALADNPRLLLLDEPLSSLDPRSGDQMRALLRKLHRRGRTVIHVTHNYEEAAALADRIIVMENSTIIQSGSPEQIFSSPKTPFVARFAGISNFIKGNLISAKNSSRKTAQFIKNGVKIPIVADGDDGPGYFMPAAENIELLLSPDQNGDSDVFPGTIKDMLPNRSGMEVIVDIGFKVSTLIDKKTAARLKPEHNKKIFARFKPTAGKFIREQ